MNIKEKITHRIELLKKAYEDDKIKAIEYEACRRSPIHFFNNYLYTSKNETLFKSDAPQDIPFVLFPYQEEFITELWESIQEWAKPLEERKKWVLTNIFIEKSRQMWATRMTMWLFVYWFVFHNHKYTIISRTQEEVDNPWDMDSCFEKLRYMLSLLPNRMLPKSYSKTPWKNSSNRHMTISNLETWASITWKTANPDAARWGTRNAIFMDEMASMQYASQINKSAWSNTPCRIFNSTPKWEWNEFYRMKKLAEKWEVKYLRYHWSEHPLYNQEWYEWKIKWMTKEQIAQELEIDYNVALVWRVYPEFKKEPDKNIIYEPIKPLYIWIDNSRWWADPHAIIVMQTDLKTHNWDIIDCIEINCSVTDIALILSRNPKITLTDAQLDFYQRYIQYNWERATFISDPYDTHSALNDTTIFQEYYKVGIHLNTPKIINKEAQILKTRANLYRIRCWEHTMPFISAISNARYPEVKENTNRTTENTKPTHDWTSHYRTALEYLTWFILQNEEIKQQTMRRKKIDNRPTRNHLTWQLQYN